jgi:hypothetical protein
VNAETTERVSVDSAEAQADGSSLSVPSISADGRFLAFHTASVRRALESAGVEFIEENGGGPGVRLAKRKAR